ncbi:hypothetical protein [Halomonas sp.]|uniref:hypothetical protein n=1 Tax=Halomonas sp. TaxID=1486246 RepID=UPI0035682C44
MNLQRSYILLALLYSALILIGILALILGGGSFIALIQVAVGTLAVIGLWGYILGKGFLNPRIWQPLAGALAAGVLLQLLVIFAGSPSSAEMTWLLSSTIFSALLVAILYRYGDRDQALWATPEEIEGGRKLGDLLNRENELVVEKQEADRQASVRVVKSGDAYRASVTRRHGEQEERFEEAFNQPSTLAFFLEKFTCITVDDITRQYERPAAG